MIVFTGVASVILKRKEGALFEAEAGGYSFSLARAVRALSPQTGFIAALSSDVPGQLIIDAMVKECIVFDPELIESDKSSAIIFREGETESRSFSLTAPVTLSEEALLNSYSTSSDIRAIHLSAEGLYYQPIFSSSLNAALFHAPRPVLIVDPASSTFPHPDEARYQRQLKEAVNEADIVLLDESEKELAVQGKSIIFADGYTDFGSFMIDRPLTKAQVLSVLNNRGCFGEGVEKPHFNGLSSLSAEDFR